MSANPLPISSNINCEPLKALIREVPDFPKAGILFYDITTLLKDKRGFAALIDAWPSITSIKRLIWFWGWRRVASFSARLWLIV